jgi:hypothetical protein
MRRDSGNGMAVLFLIAVWVVFTGLAVHHFFKVLSDIEIKLDPEKVEEMSYGDS